MNLTTRIDRLEACLPRIAGAFDNPLYVVIDTSGGVREAGTDRRFESLEAAREEADRLNVMPGAPSTIEMTLVAPPASGKDW